ncbi:MAG: hypothetical protein JWL84_1045 [Rhodospirillales bacterium]|jgi:hypothetical protein|nr:hypothetical protein [Rhodospirillales bacterium]
MWLHRARNSSKAPAIIGRGALFALFAIALQAFVAATHHHNDLFAGSFAPALPVADLTAADRHAATGELPKPAVPDDQDNCLLCWGLHMAGAFLVPQIAPVATPAMLPTIVATWEGDYGLPSRPFSLFRTRAPPTI